MTTLIIYDKNPNIDPIKLDVEGDWSNHGDPYAFTHFHSGNTIYSFDELLAWNQNMKFPWKWTGSLDQKFEILKAIWILESGFKSCPTETHAAYQEIIRLGKENKRDMIRLLMLELKNRPNWWFYAIEMIHHTDLDTHKICGKLLKLCEVYLEWGRKHGYV